MTIPAFLLAALLSLSGIEVQSDPPTAIINVTVVPMDRERSLPNQTVLVEGDRIVRIGPADEVDIPEGALRIDGSGKFLMPGLAEMHGHIPPPTQPRSEIENVLFLYVANGITTVRGMLGYPGQQELQKRAIAGDLIAPNLYLAGPSFNGNTVSSPGQAAQRVRSQKAENWDLLKIHPGLTRQEYDAIAETAHEVGIDFGGHVPSDVGLEHAIEMGQRTFDHLDGYVEFLGGAEGPVDPQKLREIVRKTRDADAWVVPTMVLWETILGSGNLSEMTSWPELKYASRQAVSSWTDAFRNRTSPGQFNEATVYNIVQARMEVLAALNDGGVGILMGTDAPQQFSVPGFSLHREMEKMVQAGMSTYEVLQSGTLNVGTYFSDKDAFGTVAEGQRADLLLLNANPLESVRNVAQRAGVMVRGRWLSEDSIQERLAEIAAHYAGDGTR